MQRGSKIDILQLGVGWYPEQAGNGLDRMFHALSQHLPLVEVRVRGLLVGSEVVKKESHGYVTAVASESKTLAQRLWAFRREARGVMQERNVDLVAGHFALFTWPILGHLEGRPLVVHFHGPWAAESAAEGEHELATRLKALVEGRVYTRADRFIVLSDAFANVLHQEYGVSRERIRIVPGGVDTLRFDTGLTRRKAREQLGWPLDRPIVLSVRRLVRRVGLEQLIDAFQTVRRELPEALLLIGGKGPLEAGLEAQIQSRGLSDHVCLLGFVPEVELPLAYRAADISVVPTQSLEGFGLIAVESLAAGTPVLVTPVGGLPEVVCDLDATLILRGSSIDALADGLTQALTGGRTLPSTEACQEYARSKFGWTNIAQQVRSVYEEVL